jgi:hypothetical protein
MLPAEKSRQDPSGFAHAIQAYTLLFTFENNTTHSMQGPNNSWVQPAHTAPVSPHNELQYQPLKHTNQPTCPPNKYAAASAPARGELVSERLDAIQPPAARHSAGMWTDNLGALSVVCVCLRTSCFYVYVLCTYLTKQGVSAKWYSVCVYACVSVRVLQMRVSSQHFHRTLQQHRHSGCMQGWQSSCQVSILTSMRFAAPSDECVVCMSGLKTWCFLPCGHKVRILHFMYTGLTLTDTLWWHSGISSAVRIHLC